jgi:hypothetical protein
LGEAIVVLQRPGSGVLFGCIGGFFLGWPGSSLDQTAYAGQDEKADQGCVFQVLEPGEQKAAPDQEGQDKDRCEEGMFLFAVHGLSLQGLSPSPAPASTLSSTCAETCFAAAAVRENPVAVQPVNGIDDRSEDDEAGRDDQEKNKDKGNKGMNAHAIENVLHRPPDGGGIVLRIISVRHD